MLVHFFQLDEIKNLCLEIKIIYVICVLNYNENGRWKFAFYLKKLCQTIEIKC